MKESTKLAVILILSLVWCATTMFAVGSEVLLLNTPIEIFMVVVPFIAFFGILVLYHLEYKAEVARGEHSADL